MKQDFPLLRLSCRIWTYDHVDRLLSETLTLPGTAYASAGTSSYDSNGALVSDTGRGISSITWNEIDLPGTVTFSDGSSVAYCYAADGTKLRETRTVSGTATVIDWCGDLVLEKTGSGPRSAKRLMMDGGYVDLATGNTARRHFVRDHLGSVRAVVDDAGTVLETDDYYPLGGPLPTGTYAALQPQKYQGKDWNATASFNVYDFGARLYDPALGRWLSQDPVSAPLYIISAELGTVAGDLLSGTGSKIGVYIGGLLGSPVGAVIVGFAGYCAVGRFVPPAVENIVSGRWL